MWFIEAAAVESSVRGHDSLEPAKPHRSPALGGSPVVSPATVDLEITPPPATDRSFRPIPTTAADGSSRRRSRSGRRRRSATGARTLQRTARELLDSATRAAEEERCDTAYRPVSPVAAAWIVRAVNTISITDSPGFEPVLQEWRGKHPPVDGWDEADSGRTVLVRRSSGQVPRRGEATKPAVRVGSRTGSAPNRTVEVGTPEKSWTYATRDRVQTTTEVAGELTRFVSPNHGQRPCRSYRTVDCRGRR